MKRATLAGALALATLFLGVSVAVVIARRAPDTVRPKLSGLRAAKSDPPLAALLAYEEERRAATDFAALPVAEAVRGADPTDLTALPGDEGYAALLRGEQALVLVDEHGQERQRVALPARPTALVLTGGATTLAVAAGPRILRFIVDREGLLQRAGGAGDGDGAPGVNAWSALAAAPDGALYGADAMTGALFAWPSRARRTAALPFGRCHGAVGLRRVDELLVVLCLLDHEVRVHRLDPRGVPAAAPFARVRLDGPIWSVDARRRGDELVLALGAVEDRPLDRSDGGFGFVDTFLYVHGVDPSTGATRRLHALNLSAAGVVTAKHVAITEATAERLTVDAIGYASDRRLEATWTAAAAPAVKTTALVPGVTGIASTRDGGSLASSDLLDAFVRIPPGPAEAAAPFTVVPAVSHGPPRSPEARLGELLFFTTLMAPWNQAEGRRSRLTCETCHYEGYGDGRVHYTGRGDVHATTKALRGLFNNRPYFSRALDKTMAQMVHAEFRVANRRNGHSPWFAIDADAVPWLRQVPGLIAALGPEALGPLELRHAFMTFLLDFTHERNPAAAGREELTSLERQGAELFRATCEGCHEARFVADDAKSRVPFERWESLVLSANGPIVWGSDVYARTGVEPYVHEAGARVPSLRRLYRKFPYFTNGSAAEVGDVLAGARLSTPPTVAQFAHHRAEADAAPSPPLRALTSDEQAALLAFLQLL